MNEAFWFYIKVFLIFPLVFVILFCSIFAGVYNINVQQGRNSCQAWSEQTSDRTKFVNTAWLEWECFVRTGGQWIPKEQIRADKAGA